MKAKVIGKIVLWALAGLLFLSVLSVGIIYFYQDKIIQLFVTEANKHIKTKVQVNKISLSLWDKFPQVAVTLNGVKITEALTNSTQPLASLEKIYCTFNLKDILGKKYRVRELFLENGEVQVRVLPSGDVNYQIFARDTTVTQNDNFAFNLETVDLKNVMVSYADARVNQYHKVTAHHLEAALDVKPAAIAIVTEGNVLIHTLQVDKSEYLKAKETTLATTLNINPDTKNVVVSPSLIQIGKADYQVSGNVNYAGKTFLDLKFSGQNTNIQSILALLPAKTIRQYAAYRSDGQVYFNGSVKGVASGKESPAIQVAFGCRGASFYHPEYKQKIQNLSLTGNFTNGLRRNGQTSVLTLKNFKGTLANRPFSGNLVYSNLADPALSLDLKADVDVAHVLGLFPVAEIKSGSGQAKLAITFAGKVRTLKAGASRTGIKAGGDIALQNVTLQLRDYRQPFRNLSGTFLIRKNDMAITNFKGWLGKSDFLLNGYFKNVLGWLFLERQHLLIEADFASDFLQLDQLLSSSGGLAGNKSSASAGANASARKDQSYKLAISPYLDFDLNADVKRLHFERFKGRNIRGTIRLKNQVISSPQIALQVMGGRFQVRGTLDARSPNTIKVSTVSNLDNIRVDSLFYVFENFGQNFITQRHLRGELQAHIDSDLYFDSYLNSKTDLMEAEVKATIRNGQLMGFEPMQKLSRFANRQELSNIKFSELSNTYFIQSRSVYIPEMEIRSNVSRASVIGIQGIHTFDQQMDYKFRIPILTKSKKYDKDERFGTVAQTGGSGAANLFLTLKGNEKDYKIAYDTDRVKTKIASDFQREKQEIKALFKGKKPEKKKEVQPQEDEYFDF